MNGRVEAAATALSQTGIRDEVRAGWDAFAAAQVRNVLAAADAFDAAHGIVRVRVDDALTEKIAEALQDTATATDVGASWDALAAAVIAALQEGAEK